MVAGARFPSYPEQPWATATTDTELRCGLCSPMITEGDNDRSLVDQTQATLHDDRHTCNYIIGSQASNCAHLTTQGGYSFTHSRQAWNLVGICADSHQSYLPCICWNVYSSIYWKRPWVLELASYPRILACSQVSHITMRIMSAFTSAATSQYKIDLKCNYLYLFCEIHVCKISLPTSQQANHTPTHHDANDGTSDW